MKKFVFVILFLTIVVTAHAQKRFELDASIKMGYYFPVNERNISSSYFPNNAFSPAAGISLSYAFLKSTGVFIGMEYSHLSPKMNDYFGNALDVTWQSFNVPFNVQQKIGTNFFLTGGVTLIYQLKGYDKDAAANSIPQQKVPEYNWQAGLGYNFNDLRISLQYYRGFNVVDKSTSSGESSWYNVDIVHQEIFVKLEYPLWKF